MNCAEPMQAEDFWVGEPSHQGRRFWETTRKLVLDVSVANVLEIFRRVRRSVGWLPDRATELVATRQNCPWAPLPAGGHSRPRRNEIWVLERATTWDWEEPSQNWYSDKIKINSWRPTAPMPGRSRRSCKIVCESEAAWIEPAHNWGEYHTDTESLVDRSCTMCAPLGYTRKVIAEVLPCS